MNLFELFVKIGVDDQASGKLKDIGGKLGNGLKTAAKIGTAAVGAAAAGITALTTAAVNNYAEYEQLVGGIETLFEDLSWDVGQNAAKAFQTAGLSANEYMSTAMSFAASLNQSLTEMDGNIARSADLTDQAILDMADNANKMGSDMSTLQTAYAGFAKQNYTLLDNLKIGYGGTKEEMQRLIADAAKLSDTVDAQSMSFANIVEAIHVVQTEMGITGTTALEASQTISGSVSSMKAAWQNLLTGISDGNADVGKLMDNFVTTIVGDGTERNLGVLGNVLPTVKTALNGIGKLIKEVVPVALDYIPQIITDFLPQIAESSVGIVSSIADTILENIDKIIDTGIDIIEYLKDGIIENIPTIVDSAAEIINTLSEKVVEFSGVLAEAAYELVDALGNELSEQIPGLSGVFENLETVIISLTAAFVAYKAATAISGIIDALRKATEGQTIAQALLNAVMNANPFVLIATLIAGLVAAVITLWNTNDGFRAAVITAWEAIKSAASTIFTAIAEFFTVTIPEAFNSFVTFISDGVSSFLSIGSEIVENIKQGINDAWNGLVEWFNGIWDSLFGNRTVDVDVDTSEGAPSSRANGLSYVPYDGYYALLHEGERVLTAEENKAYNSGATGNTSGITIIQNIQSVPQTPVEFAAATEAYFEQARWAFA